MSTTTYGPGTFTYTVGAGVTQIQVTAEAAAGGASSGASGGNGGKIVCTLPTTPGWILTVKVGAAGTASGLAGSGGRPGGSGSVGAGGGGGSTEVWLGSTRLIVVGAGGGAVAGHDGYAGGAGKTTGTDPVEGAGAELGGTLTAGGTADGAGTNGTSTAGGNGDPAGGGGGGGGWFGGGGSDSGEGGGGGSGHLDASITTYTATRGFNTGAGSCTLTTLNTPPNAPILLYPPTGASIGYAVDNAFRIQFSDPDPRDSQSGLNIRYKLVSGGSWTVVHQATPSGTVVFPAGTFTANDFEWQAQCYDAQGALGPYSASSFFTGVVAPDAPVVTSPTAGATIDTGNVTVTFTYPSAIDSHTYQVQGDLDGAADPTNVIIGNTVITDPTVRSDDLTGLPNNTAMHILLLVTVGGIDSGYTDVPINVVFDPPPTPTVTVVPNDDTGSITVIISTDAPGDGEVAAVSAALLISVDQGATWWTPADAVMLPPSCEYVYPIPQSGVDHWFQALDAAASGATSSSGWISEGSDVASVVYRTALWYGDESPPVIPQADIDEAYVDRSTGNVYELEDV